LAQPGLLGEGMEQAALVEGVGPVQVVMMA
jgi:hypothetical protein